MDLTIPCEFCGLTNFNSRKEFSNHLASHQSEFNCKEPHCNKTFLTRDKMRYHNRTAHASPVNCQCCDKQFKTEKLLRNHVKVVEAAHAKFDIFWRRYKVLDVESESHGEALLNCLNDFNTKNI